MSEFTYAPGNPGARKCARPGCGHMASEHNPICTRDCICHRFLGAAPEPAKESARNSPVRAPKPAAQGLTVETKPTESAAPGLRFGQVWWTSTWPLLTVSFVSSIATGGRPMASGAILWGWILALWYAKRPVLGFWRALGRALVVMLPAQGLLLLALYRVLSEFIYIDLEELVGSVLVATIGSCAAWAFFVVRKGRRLLGAEPTRGRLGVWLATGWGRLVLVLWAGWAAAAWFIAKPDYYRWSEEDYFLWGLLAVGVPGGLGGIFKWVSAGFRGRGLSRSPSAIEPAGPEENRLWTRLGVSSSAMEQERRHALETKMQATGSRRSTSAGPISNATCLVCGGRFAFATGQLELMVLEGRKGFICAQCATEVNQARLECGLEPYEILQGAYRP